MSGLVPSSYRPLVPVAVPYCPGPGVFAWRTIADGAIVQEILRDPGYGYMVRYLAWVNFPAVDGTPNHQWWAHAPRQPMDIPDVVLAATFADENARTYELTFGEWIAAKRT